MRWIGFAIAVLVLLAVAAGAWLQIIYGTFEPCRALSAELQRDVARRAGIPAYKVEEDPRSHNASPAAISARVEGMTTWQCTTKLFGELMTDVQPAR